MESSNHIAGSALAELDRLVEAALQDLAAEDAARGLSEDGDDPALSDPTVSQVLEAADRLREVTKLERLHAPALADRLERHPGSRAKLLIDHRAQFQTWGLCEELLDRTPRAIFSGDPHRAVRIARLAVWVAERLDDDLYRGGLAMDLRARSWGALGNALRCASQFEAAAEAFRTAEGFLEEGSGDPLEQANLFSLRASLAFWLGDLDAALSAIERAEAIYSELDEDTLLGKILVQKAYAAGYREPELGVRYSRRAERLIDPEVDGHLFLSARNTHIFWLVESGQPERARMLLDASRSLYRRHDDPWFRLRRAGLEARLLFASGELREAEAGYEVVLAEQTEQGLHLEALVTALELAACRLALGNAAGAAEIAAAMVPHLRECGAHSHAREAWALFRHSLQVHRASEELIQEVKTYLRVAWKNPRLRFSSQLTAASRQV